MGKIIIDQLDGTIIDLENIDPVKHFLRRRYKIAKTLSHICRFGGKVKRFWSVMDHTMLFYHIYRDINAVNYNDMMWILIHEFFEGLTVDIISPIKREFPLYSELENKALTDLAQILNLTPEMPKHLKEMDFDVAMIEAYYLTRLKGNDKDIYLNRIKNEKIKEIIGNGYFESFVMKPEYFNNLLRFHKKFKILLKLNRSAP